MKQIVKIDASRCKSCGLCVDACPRHYLIIGTERNPAGHCFVTTQPNEMCVGCGTCVMVCPEPLAIALVPGLESGKIDAQSHLTNTRHKEQKQPVDATDATSTEDEDFSSFEKNLSDQAVESITSSLVRHITESIAENVTNEIIRKLQEGELKGMMQAAATGISEAQETRRAFLKGNDAVVCAAIASGCRAFFGYPITPASEIAHDAMAMLPKAGAVAIQAESEVSAINMLYGAASVGVKAMTATSGPGFSLMQEGISYMAAARLPGVIVNVMRAGPGLGNIGPEQADYFMATRGGGHGHYHTPVLAPANVSEMFSLTVRAFDVAFTYRTPVIVLADAFIGQVMETVDLPKALTMPAPCDATWAADPALPPNVISSLELDPSKREKQNDARFKAYDEMIEALPMYSLKHAKAPKALCVAFGICARIADQVRHSRQNFDLFRPISLWPFPQNALRKAAQNMQHILVIECNRGQMLEDIQRILPDKTIHFLGHDGGTIPTTKEIEDLIEHL